MVHHRASAGGPSISQLHHEQQLSRGHHRASAGGTSISQLHHEQQLSRGHHRASAGGTSISQLHHEQQLSRGHQRLRLSYFNFIPNRAEHAVAQKLKHHRLK